MGIRLRNKGQMFIIIAVILIVILVILKTGVNIPDIAQKNRELEGRFEHNFFVNVADELTKTIDISYHQPNDITNNVFSKQSLIAIFMSSNNSFKHNDFYVHRLSQPIITFVNADNTWQRNFWMRPRILPKLIFGYKYTIPYSNLTQSSLDIDWRPTLKPNNPIPNCIHNEMHIQQKMQHLWIQFDWHPAKEPYGLPGMR